MYFRRLRSIMDQFLNGYVQGQFTTNYNIIVAAAKKDNAKWNGGDPALGFKCDSSLPSVTLVYLSFNVCRASK